MHSTAVKESPATDSPALCQRHQHGPFADVAGGQAVFEAVPRLRKDLDLPVWAFSARAKHKPGGAPAVVCLTQPKLVPGGMQINTGETSQVHLGFWGPW